MNPKHTKSERRKTRSRMNKKIGFEEREFKGSRLRCLQLTSMSRPRLQGFLRDLVGPHASIPEDFHHLPRGFVEANESVLGELDGFPSEISQTFAELKKWWLVLEKGRLPNWDLVSTCEIGNRPGLILVEAKSHEAELKGRTDSSGVASDNKVSIEKALEEAGAALGSEQPGFRLSVSEFFQLSNRFAFSWKLATMGVPVVLVYLGFLDAEEMGGSCRILKDGNEWDTFVKQLSAPCIPSEAWGHPFCDGAFLPLIRSARVDIAATVVPA
jgi:hypothetical protein